CTASTTFVNVRHLWRRLRERRRLHWIGRQRRRLAIGEEKRSYMALGKLAGTPVGSSGQPAQVVHDVLALGWRWGKLRAGRRLRVLFGPHGDLTRSMTATTPTAKATIANPTRLAEMNRAFRWSLARFRSRASKRVVKKRNWISSLPQSPNRQSSSGAGLRAYASVRNAPKANRRLTMRPRIEPTATHRETPDSRPATVLIRQIGRA